MERAWAQKSYRYGSRFWLCDLGEVTYILFSLPNVICKMGVMSLTSRGEEEDPHRVSFFFLGYTTRLAGS